MKKILIILLFISCAYGQATKYVWDLKERSTINNPDMFMLITDSTAWTPGYYKNRIITYANFLDNLETHFPTLAGTNVYTGANYFDGYTQLEATTVWGYLDIQPSTGTYPSLYLNEDQARWTTSAATEMKFILSGYNLKLEGDNDFFIDVETTFDNLVNINYKTTLTDTTIVNGGGVNKSLYLTNTAHLYIGTKKVLNAARALDNITDFDFSDGYRGMNWGDDSFFADSSGSDGIYAKVNGSNIVNIKSAGMDVAGVIEASTAMAVNGNTGVTGTGAGIANTVGGIVTSYSNNLGLSGNVVAGDTIISEGDMVATDGFSSDTTAYTQVYTLASSGGSSGDRYIGQWVGNQGERIEIEIIGTSGFNSTTTLNRRTTILGQYNNNNSLYGQWWAIGGSDVAKISDVQVDSIGLNNYKIYITHGTYLTAAVRVTTSGGVFTKGDALASPSAGRSLTEQFVIGAYTSINDDLNISGNYMAGGTAGLASGTYTSVTIKEGIVTAGTNPLPEMQAQLDAQTARIEELEAQIMQLLQKEK